jgi:ParB-like chromosome segregation protein Spo0J
MFRPLLSTVKESTLSHPSLQLFDALPPSIEAALRTSIERFGVLVPVVKDQHGRIIDGHHRATVADKLGVTYRVDVIPVADDDQARELARTLNADRRHLTEDQRREVAVTLRRAGHSERAIAGALGVSQPTVHRDIERATDSLESVELPDRVTGLDGKSRPARRPTIVAARNDREAERAQEALATIGDIAPARVVDVKRIERIAREAEAKQRRSEPQSERTVIDSIDIRHGDFRTVLADIPDASVDAIITDPPYPREFIPLFGDLSKLAARILKPAGVLAVMTGQTWLRGYLAELDRHMRYRWCGAYLVQGQRNRVHGARVGTGWKPVLLYSRMDAPTDCSFILDDLFDSAGGDKAYHDWGQSESGMAMLVGRLSQPGQSIVDPFLGGGTTAVVCRDLERRFIGCDIDAAAVAVARGRLQ